MTVRNRAAMPSPPVVIGLSADWFDHYSIIGAIPPVLDDRVQDDGFRYFDFPGAAPGADVTFELHRRRSWRRGSCADGATGPAWRRVARRRASRGRRAGTPPRTCARSERSEARHPNWRSRDGLGAAAIRRRPDQYDRRPRRGQLGAGRPPWRARRRRIRAPAGRQARGRGRRRRRAGWTSATP